MRIAQIAPLNQRVPPPRYGGTLVSVVPHPLREAHILDSTPFTVAEVAKVYKKAHNFDIIHNHAWPDYLTFAAASQSKTPTVTTLHNPFWPETRRVFDEYKNLNFIAISNNQRRSNRNLSYCGTVYNGVPVEKFPFRKNHNDYLFHLGRISLQKGTHIAIDIATALKKELIIAAKLDPWEVEYFNQYVAPRLSNGHVHWVGEVDETERNKLMSKALCLLHPATWREPFGMSMIEAMAVGCPVVAFKRGSVPELVVNGKTGFVVENEKQMVRAVKKIDSIDRRECRIYVKKNFTIGRMADDYEKIYNKIIESNGKC
jgi:glycosyltransferase involved in cell wall biosynthesis